MAINQGFKSGLQGSHGGYFVGAAKNLSVSIRDNVIFPDRNGNYFKDDPVNPVTAKEGITGREGNTPHDPGSKNELQQQMLICYCIIYYTTLNLTSMYLNTYIF